MRIKAVVLAISLFALPGCKDDAPTGPSAEEYKSEREAMVARVQKGRSALKADTKRAAKAPAKPGSAFPAQLASIGLKIAYDATGKRDPFRSFEWEQKANLLQMEIRGPLEQFEVGQLSVVGMVWKTKRGEARALIQDPAGKNYIVGKGTRIGKNEGHVVQIDDNLLVVKERYVDFLGEETTKDIEMRIRRSEGG